jgi:hypothetical protein
MEVLTAPALFNWVFGGLAVMAGLGALGLALWSALGDRLLPEGPDSDSAMPAVPLVTAVEESLDDLRAEGDPRRAIVRCYARFERVAADSGLERRPWLTPTEFMREVLARMSLPRANTGPHGLFGWRASAITRSARPNGIARSTPCEDRARPRPAGHAGG